jgi:hypothetical protein
MNDLHAHIRNPENYLAVRDHVSGEWIGTVYRTLTGGFSARRFFDGGWSDAPHETIEDAVEAIYLSWYRFFAPGVDGRARVPFTGRPLRRRRFELAA